MLSYATIDEISVVRSFAQGKCSKYFGAGMRRDVLATLCCGLLLVWTGLSQPVAAKRVALVIGNDSYREVTKLEKAVNDANAMATTLSEIGFEVIRATNVTRREMNRNIQLFASKLDLGDEALFFYAGHGVEIAGRNFLLPVDIPAAKPGHENFITSESIAVDRILDHIKSRNARISILMLDACRDNPFASEASRGIGGTRGLARTIAPKGTFIMYSAGVGQLALDRLNRDDPHTNSVFTRSIIPLIKRPGLSLVQMARQVRRDVEKLAATVSHVQRPAYYDEVTGDFYFNGGRKGSVQEPARTAAPADPASATWSVIQNTTSEAVLAAFIKEFPDSVFATFARARLKEVQANRAAGKPTIAVAKAEPTRTAEDIVATGGTPVIDPDLTGSELSTLVQTELNRIGCSAGAADGNWGKKSRAALRLYIRHASHPVALREPDVALLAMLRAEKNRVCPLVCTAGQVPGNGRCVVKTCGAGQVLSSRGKCVAAKRKTVTTCASGQRVNSKGVCYTPKSQTTRATPSGAGKGKSTSRSKSSNQVASRSACRAGKLSACRARCSAGVKGACLKAKCITGNLAACRRLRARAQRR